jgi:hypothetical protein
MAQSLSDPEADALFLDVGAELERLQGAWLKRYLIHRLQELEDEIVALSEPEGNSTWEMQRAALQGVPLDDPVWDRWMWLEYLKASRAAVIEALRSV